MRKKRAKTTEKLERNIYRDIKTGHYKVKFYYGTIYGKPKSAIKTYKTEKEAKKALKDFEAQKRLEQITVPQNIRLREYIPQYLAKKAEYVKPATLESYEQYGKMVVKTQVANMKITSMKARDIKAIIEELYKDKEVKAITKNKMLRFLHGIFDYAIKDEIIKYNIVMQVPPYRETEEFIGSFYTKAELLEIVDKFKEQEPNNEIMIFYLGALLGLRRGEINALKWEDIDIEKKTLTINRTAATYDGQRIETAPKTAQSKRIIGFTDELKNIFVAHRQKQKENCTSDYVIANIKTGEPYAVNTISIIYEKMCKQYEIKKIRLHDLRHTFATIASEQGTDIKDISKALGHANEQITMKVYRHLIPEVNTRAVSSISDFLFTNDKTQQ